MGKREIITKPLGTTALFWILAWLFVVIFVVCFCFFNCGSFVPLQCPPHTHLRFQKHATSGVKVKQTLYEGSWSRHEHVMSWTQKTSCLVNYIANHFWCFWFESIAIKKNEAEHYKRLVPLWTWTYFNTLTTY